MGKPYNLLFARRMGKYSTEPTDAAKACKAKGSDLRVHFKNTREAAMAIRGKTLNDAKSFLEAVMDKKRCVVFRRFCGGVGRTAESNAESKGIDTDTLSITHIQVQQAMHQRRRTY